MRAVYRIFNSKTGKFYVGSSVNVRNRFKDHKSQLRAGTHCNQYLQHAWNKYGEPAFVFEILEVCNGMTADELLGREQEYIDSTDCLDQSIGYNLSSQANRPCVPRTAEMNAKVSAALKGKKKTAQHVANMRAALTGRRLSAEHAAKNARANLGRRFTAEHRAKMAAAATGRVLSVAARAKIAAANAGGRWAKAPSFWLVLRQSSNDGNARRGANVIHDFSRHRRGIRRKGRFAGGRCSLSFDAVALCHAGPTKVADYFAGASRQPIIPRLTEH